MELSSPLAANLYHLGSWGILGILGVWSGTASTDWTPCLALSDLVPKSPGDCRLTDEDPVDADAGVNDALFGLVISWIVACSGARARAVCRVTVSDPPRTTLPGSPTRDPTRRLFRNHQTSLRYEVRRVHTRDQATSGKARRHEDSTR